VKCTFVAVKARLVVSFIKILEVAFPHESFKIMLCMLQISLTFDNIFRLLKKSATKNVQDAKSRTNACVLFVSGGILSLKYKNMQKPILLRH